MSSVDIIIVEDNPADVLLVEEALRGHGIEFRLERYTNGEDAAKAFAAMEQAPSLILVDLNVPRIHGLELLRIIRACPALAGALVAVLTSSQTASERVQSQQRGADAYIVKPPGYHEFVERVGGSIAALLGGGTGTDARLAILCGAIAAAGLVRRTRLPRYRRL